MKFIAGLRIYLLNIAIVDPFAAKLRGNNLYIFIITTLYIRVESSLCTKYYTTVLLT